MTAADGYGGQTDHTPAIMGCHMIDYKPPLVHIEGRLTVNRYVTQVAEPVVRRLLQGAPKTVFQHDMSGRTSLHSELLAA
ncbi:hypothetical protein TNCV_1714821 [Trichonephila clavipes]|nr:hypothetical protein TNCV_1714821 [Trichonephila clavipes]